MNNEAAEELLTMRRMISVLVERLGGEVTVYDADMEAAKNVAVERTQFGTGVRFVVEKKEAETADA